MVHAAGGAVAWPIWPEMHQIGAKLLLEHCAAAKACHPPRALTAATTAPSPAQASGRTPRHPARP